MATWLDYGIAADQNFRANQEQQLRQQQAQQQMFLFQQAQQDRQRAQAAQTAAGNALPQLLQSGQVAAQPQQGQMPPPPQPPAPGQASQPMQPPQGAPLPGMGPAPGGVQPPLPPGGVQGQGQPQQLPPFRPMPTTPPQSAAPQGAIPAPPAQAAATSPADRIPGGGLTLQGAVEALRGQGLSGADLIQGLQQLQPVLDAASQRQSAMLQQQFNRELQVARLEQQHQAIQQRAEDASLNRDLRRELAGQAQASRMQLAQFRLNATGANAVQSDTLLDKDARHQMAEDYLAAPDPSIFTNLGRGKQGAANVVGLRNEIAALAKERGLTGADLAALRIGVGGEKAAARAAGTKAANVELAASEAQKTFGLVREASAQLPRTQFVPVNRALQAAQTNTGDPNVIRLGTALNTSINAYARAISPSGTPTVSDKEHARELLSTANTPEQLTAALDIMEKEMSAARQAPAEVKAAQRARISGKPAEGAAPAIPQGWSVTEH